MTQAKQQDSKISFSSASVAVLIMVLLAAPSVTASNQIVEVKRDNCDGQLGEENPATSVYVDGHRVACLQSFDGCEEGVECGELPCATAKECFDLVSECDEDGCELVVPDLCGSEDCPVPDPGQGCFDLLCQFWQAPGDVSVEIVHQDYQNVHLSYCYDGGEIPNGSEDNVCHFVQISARATAEWQGVEMHTENWNGHLQPWCTTPFEFALITGTCTGRGTSYAVHLAKDEYCSSGTLVATGKLIENTDSKGFALGPDCP